MKPVGKKLKLEIEEVTIGMIKSEAIEEKGKIIEIGNEVKMFKVGQTVYFKSWAIDIISLGENKHYFITEDSDALCAVED